MLFNSYIYIFLFLPCILCLYFFANYKGKYDAGKGILIIGSILFISYVNITCGVVMIISIGINGIINACLDRDSNSDGRKRVHILCVGVVFNILFLAVFKYAGFILEFLKLNHAANIPNIHIVLPLGISFYTFQQISYLADHYRREIDHFNALDYVLYVSFFPKLIQGPLAYYSELNSQFNDPKRKNLNSDNIARGIYLFSIGLFKKVLVADNFGIIVDYAYGHISSINSLEAVLAVIGYTLQIYFDFSGYTDMALGSAYMLNIELPWNFLSPYKALNVNDFWKRWHITLTRFLTKYVYIPLGGNRKGKRRTYLNILIVFFVSGIWHGAGFGFILWGLMHGLASVAYRMTKKWYDSLSRAIQWVLNFLFINIAWVFFRAESISDGAALIQRIFTGDHALFINAELTESLLQPTLNNIFAQLIPFVYVVIILTVLATAVCVICRNSRERTLLFKTNLKTCIITYVFLMVGILSLSGVSGFLYSNF